MVWPSRWSRSGLAAQAQSSWRAPCQSPSFELDIDDRKKQRLDSSVWQLDQYSRGIAEPGCASTLAAPCRQPQPLVLLLAFWLPCGARPKPLARSDVVLPARYADRQAHGSSIKCPACRGPTCGGVVRRGRTRQLDGQRAAALGACTAGLCQPAGCQHLAAAQPVLACCCRLHTLFMRPRLCGPALAGTCTRPALHQPLLQDPLGGHRRLRTVHRPAHAPDLRGGVLQAQLRLHQLQRLAPAAMLARWHGPPQAAAEGMLTWRLGSHPGRQGRRAGPSPAVAAPPRRAGGTAWPHPAAQDGLVVAAPSPVRPPLRRCTSQPAQGAVMLCRCGSSQSQAMLASRACTSQASFCAATRMWAPASLPSQPGGAPQPQC